MTVERLTINEKAKILRILQHKIPYQKSPGKKAVIYSAIVLIVNLPIEGQKP